MSNTSPVSGKMTVVTQWLELKPRFFQVPSKLAWISVDSIVRDSLHDATQSSLGCTVDPARFSVDCSRSSLADVDGTESSAWSLVVGCTVDGTGSLLVDVDGTESSMDVHAGGFTHFFATSFTFSAARFLSFSDKVSSCEQISLKK